MNGRQPLLLALTTNEEAVDAVSPLLMLDETSVAVGVVVTDGVAADGTGFAGVVLGSAVPAEPLGPLVGVLELTVEPLEPLHPWRDHTKSTATN